MAKKTSDIAAAGDEDTYLKKAVEAIHMTGRLNKTEKRIFNFLIKYAYEELGVTDVHRISYRQLTKDIEYNSENIQHIRAALEGILGTKMTLDLFNEKGVPDGFHGINILSEVKLRNGVISYSFPPTLRDILKDPKVFAQVNLTLANKFSTVHAANLYEQIERFHAVRTTGFKEIGVWREVIGAAGASYDVFKVFNYNVLKPAIAEINKKTNHIVTLVTKKTGRVVTHLKFDIETVGKTVVEPAVSSTVELDELTKMLTSFGLSVKEALSAIGDHPVEYVEGNIKVVKDKIKAGKLKNPSAAAVWMKQALKEDWRKPLVTVHEDVAVEIEIEKKKAQEIKKAKEEEEKKKKAQAAESDGKNKSKREEAFKYFESLPLKSRNSIEKKFLSFAEKNNSLIHQNYLSPKLNKSVVVQNFWGDWLISQMEIGGI